MGEAVLDPDKVQSFPAGMGARSSLEERLRTPLEIETVIESLWILAELAFSILEAFGLETFWELCDCSRIAAAH